MGTVKKETPYSMYLRLFAEATGQQYSMFRKRFTSIHAQQFGQRISNWKIRHAWTDHEITGLICYCYWFNPLGDVSPTAYGSLDAIGQCILSFKLWLRANEDRIVERGLITALYGAAHIGEVDGEMYKRAMTLDEVREAYGIH